MQTLAIKYRPKTFEDVVEQGPIKAILKDQLDTKSNKNCYLFTGGAGTGKTTTARIFASEINQFKGNPIEIDGASNNGVDNVREIIEDAKFKALDAEFKVYIIDECHMLSTGAWNAMLKLIEEPPAKTLFLFCTTDPQKIPSTILSRVQRYDFTRITHDGIVSRLLYILAEESVNGEIEFEVDAIEYIAKIADGGMRDAITLLDKCLSYTTDITLEAVIKVLGAVNYMEMFELTDNIYACAKKEVIEQIEQIHRGGIDLKQFIKSYNYFVLDLCKYDLTGSFDFIQIPKIYGENLETLENEFYDFVHEFLAVTNKLVMDTRWEVAPKSLIQATLLQSMNI